MEPTQSNPQSNALNDLLDKVAKLDPLMRGHADEAERERRLSKPVAEALRDAGVFRMFRPLARSHLVGSPFSPDTMLRAVVLPNITTSGSSAEATERRNAAATAARSVVVFFITGSPSP